MPGGQNSSVAMRSTQSNKVAELWRLARDGDFRGAVAGVKALKSGRRIPAAAGIQLKLLLAFCAMRQGQHEVALEELHAAARTASLSGAQPVWQLRVAAWRNELAYFQGRYSEAISSVEQNSAKLEGAGDFAYAAFALRTLIAMLLARADYDGIAKVAPKAIQLAQDSGDVYVLVQVLNVLGTAAFDRATAKLRVPHARAHLSALDASDTPPMETDARHALDLFQRAHVLALNNHYDFAAWYVGGNIERLQIVLGNADQVLPMIRKRLRVLQKRGAKYDEIVARSNLAWALRLLSRHQEALHELDVALRLARATGTFNTLLEFIEYDRSIVQDALGDRKSAAASYRRYLQIVGGRNPATSPLATAPLTRRPLEPYYLKRAQRVIDATLGAELTVRDLARECGVSERLLEKGFAEFRGMPPVAYMRNRRLDRAFHALQESHVTVAEAARIAGYGSSTTFAAEFRRRFGIAPRLAKDGSSKEKPHAKDGVK
jgi:AraC-like DNA-binding protein